VSVDPADPDGDGDLDGPQAALEPEDLNVGLTAALAAPFVAKEVG
jgi:hypothetical protein